MAVDAARGPVRGCRQWGVRTRHNGGHGDVPSSRTPTASGMSSQCPAWRCRGGDGRTGLTTTVKTAPAVLTSQSSPVLSREKHSRVPPAPFEGSARKSYRSRRHCVTGLTPASSHSVTHGRDGLPGESVEQGRGVIPRRVRVVACILWCQSTKCP
jgi:hypothetical protein